MNAEDASTASGSAVSSSSSTVGGESRAAAKEISDAVQSVEMTLDNKPVDANTKIYYFSQFALKAKLALSGKAVNEGDYTVGDMGLGEGLELQYFVEIGEVP